VFAFLWCTDRSVCATQDTGTRRAKQGHLHSTRERIVSNEIKTPTAARPSLSKASTVTRFAIIGIALAAVAGTFAYLGGWLTPGELTPARLTDGFEQVDGIHAGFRRNHAKGVGVTGIFESNGEGVRLSKAVVFRPGRIPVIGRFSLGGGQPYAADKPATVCGLGLQFSLPYGELWRTAMVNLPVFPFRTPQAFYEHLIATKPEIETGKPDPAKMKAFLDSHPETVQAFGVIGSQAISSGFENSTFRGLNAFRFINSSGESIAARWLLIPDQPFESASSASNSDAKNYLFDALIEQVHRRPLQWHLIVIIGKAGDPTNDASVAWPDEREKVDVGTLTLDQVESDETSAATDINFDPLVLPAGIVPSDDPLLSARSAVYSQSYTRRAGEAKQPSAITPAEVRKGE
jgi:catalase